MLSVVDTFSFLTIPNNKIYYEIGKCIVYHTEQMIDESVAAPIFNLSYTHMMVRR